MLVFYSFHISSFSLIQQREIRAIIPQNTSIEHVRTHAMNKNERKNINWFYLYHKIIMKARWRQHTVWELGFLLFRERRKKSLFNNYYQNVPAWILNINLMTQSWFFIYRFAVFFLLFFNMNWIFIKFSCLRLKFLFTLWWDS